MLPGFTGTPDGIVSYSMGSCLTTVRRDALDIRYNQSCPETFFRLQPKSCNWQFRSLRYLPDSAVFSQDLFSASYQLVKKTKKHPAKFRSLQSAGIRTEMLCLADIPLLQIPDSPGHGSFSLGFEMYDVGEIRATTPANGLAFISGSTNRAAFHGLRFQVKNNLIQLAHCPGKLLLIFCTESIPNYLDQLN